jgi:peptidoglycan/LPS O-acetylase OafA/YrhL
MDDALPSRPITIAQAWSAPILICLLGAGFALWGFRARPEARDVTAALVIMIVGPVTAAALIARGVVGLHQRHRWQGCVAIFLGVLLFVGVVVGFNAIEWRGDGIGRW